MSEQKQLETAISKIIDKRLSKQTLGQHIDVLLRNVTKLLQNPAKYITPKKPINAAPIRKEPYCQINGCKLKQFRTPLKGYSSFSCDNCGQAQPKVATLYGCRTCNYDLCYHCFHRSNLFEPVEESPSVVEIEDEVVKFPQPLTSINLGKCLEHCYKKQYIELCEVLFRILSFTSLERDGRTKELLDITLLICEEHFKNQEIMRHGCSCLSKLLLDFGEELKEDQIKKTVDFVFLALNSYEGNEYVFEKVIGLITPLHDKFPSLVRDKITSCSFRLNLQKNFDSNHGELVQNTCAIASRIPSMIDKNVMFPVLLDLISKFSNSDQVCEQIFAAIISISEPQMILENVQTAIRKRFAL